MQATQRTQRTQRFAGLARQEDWLLAGWMAVAAPLLARAQDGAGPFDAGRPLDGVLGIVAVLGALACLVTTSSDRLADGAPNILERAAIGPLIGGLLLVVTSAFDGLSLPETVAWALTMAAFVALVVLRIRRPKLPTATRRGLVTPFTLVAGNLFAAFIHQITGDAGLDGWYRAADLGGLAFGLGVLVVFAAVFYTMLVYAPRQVAEAEGSPRTWLIRFAIFVAATAFGLGWLGILGG